MEMMDNEVTMKQEPAIKAANCEPVAESAPMLQEPEVEVPPVNPAPGKLEIAAGRFAIGAFCFAVGYVIYQKAKDRYQKRKAEREAKKAKIDVLPNADHVDEDDLVTVDN
jgi:hypothetical protein